MLFFHFLSFLVSQVLYLCLISFLSLICALSLSLSLSSSTYFTLSPRGIFSQNTPQKRHCAVLGWDKPKAHVCVTVWVPGISSWRKRFAVSEKHQSVLSAQFAERKWSECNYLLLYLLCMTLFSVKPHYN